MKMLNSDMTKLLDKLYNLRFEDSVILVSMDREREAAEQTRDKTSALKTQLQDRIGELTAEETVLADEGAKLKNALSSIRKSEFATVIEHLHIDFDPDAIKRKVESSLPATLDRVANEKKKAAEELLKVEDEMNEAITKIEELGIRKDEALANQEKLNNFFDLALSSNINITRDEITSLLSNFDFTEEEQREAAKLMMFPEDGLFLYDKAFKGRPTGEMISDTPPEAEETKEEEEPPVQTEVPKAPIEKKEEEEIPLVEATQIVEPKEVVTEKLTKEALVDEMTAMGFDYLDFTNNDVAKMLDNFNRDMFQKNIKIMDGIGIKKDVFLDNIELLYDPELEAKIKTLTDIGKQPQDIYLNPNVLVKYNLEELKSAIKMLHESGLDPKSVPLMAY